MTFALILLLQDKFFVGKDEIPIKDIVENESKVYVRSSSLEKPLGYVARLATDKSALGVMRDKVGGRAMKIGKGEEALIHSGDVFVSLEAIEAVLCAKVVRDIGRVDIDLKPTGEVVKKSGLVAGDRMIDFVLAPLKAKDPVQLTKFPKKRILLAIWAPWHDGRGEVATWQAAYAKHKNEGLVVIGVAVDATGPEKALDYVPAKVSIPLAHDPYWTTLAALGADGFPRYVLVDELGFIRARTDTFEDALDAWKKLPAIEDHKIKAWVKDDNAGDWKKSGEDIEKDARLVLQAIPDSWEGAIRAFAGLCKQGKPTDGVAVLKEYLKLKDSHTILRRQKWAVEFPDRMYGGSFDEKWLTDQEDLEKRGG